MGAIFDIYQLIRDLIEEAEKQKNISLVNSLIDIKKQISDLQDENRELRNQLEINSKIVRHKDGVYITLADDSEQIHYCAVCWGKEGKLIQMHDRGCILCETRWIEANH